MTSPITEPLLNVPHVGITEFKTAPTWLDLQDLVENGTQAQQDAELYNVLLRASLWANNFCGMPLQAHTAYEQTRARVDRRGRMFIHPKDNPIRSITGLAYGPDWKNLTILTDLTQTYPEDQRGIIVSAIPFTGSLFGQLQFGSAPRSGSEVYVEFQYVAGYANTYLTSAATSGGNTLTVADPTGFQAPATSPFNTTYGGSVARIWDPANEEAVAISANYVSGANPLALAGSLASNHAIGVQVSEMPAEVRQAVITYAVGLLMRENAAEDMPYAGSPGVVARRSSSGGQSGGLIEEAERLLMPYRRVR